MRHVGIAVFRVVGFQAFIHFTPLKVGSLTSPFESNFIKHCLPVGTKFSDVK